MMVKTKKPDNHRPLLYVVFKKFGLRGGLQLLRSDVWFDLANRVNTAAPVSRYFLYQQHRRDTGNRYVASTFSVMNGVLSFTSSRLNLSECGFVDLGSGKAKALICAAKHPFQSIRGVEISERLHAVAQRNLVKLGLSQRVSLVCGSAETFVLQPHERVVYLFNPFTGDTLERCLSNIETSHRNGPGILIYVNPTERSQVQQHFKLLHTEFLQPGNCEVSYFSM